MNPSDQQLYRRASRTFLTLGATIGALAVIVWATGWMPSLPPWLVRLAVLKLTFIGAAGFLAAGALLGRRARPEEGTRQLGDADAAMLGAGSGPGLGDKVPSPDERGERVPRQREL